jgi:hypothetical protein
VITIRMVTTVKDGGRMNGVVLRRYESRVLDRTNNWEV